MLGHDELDIEERIAAPVTLEAFEDFLEWHQIHDYELAPGSLPVLLGWDVRRQFGEAGFPVWRDLMHSIEPPLLAENLLGPGDPRTPCTTAEYEAALVDDWAAFARPHHWTDHLIVDQMAAAQREGWEPCAGDEVNAAIEAVLDDLAKRSGAKRAVIQAEIDALDAAEIAEIRAKQDTEFAVYEAWLAAGESATDPLADEHRARKQLIQQARVESEHRTIDLTGMPMPTPPQLSIVPTVPAPDYLTSSRDFLATFEPPEFLIDETVQMRYFYSLTAATGVGKTAIAMRWMGHVVLGKPIGEREVQQGDVLYLAGENPSDVLYRWMALSRDMGIDPETERVTWMVGAKDLTVAGLTMATEAVRKGRTFKLIIVDTAAAYNFGDNENDNSQAGAYARQLRSLVNMPGGPCVIALCHPTKRAADDDLMPRGGGAFIAEVDGNMAVMKKEGLLAVVPFGKFRGDTSWSHHYELEKITDHPKLKDARGRQMASVIARPIASTSVEIKARNGHNEAITLLHAVFNRPGLNATELARHLNWTYGKAAEPHKNKVNRLMESLVAQKLVRETMGRWKATSKGQEALNDADSAAARAPRPMFPVPGVNS